ncbi:serine--tRNA ligase [Candidatus Wolfebacteria bacterium]|nr:serine--tRNA ligase [Candidatus Wolfebacteria bacterium]
MLDINFIRNNPDAVREGISFKKADPRLVDDFLSFDKSWRELVNETDNLRSEQNKAGKNREIEKAKELKEQIRRNEERLKNVEEEREKILRLLPNLPMADVPAGKDESENQVIRKWGEIPKFDFEPKDHLDLGEALDVIDVKTASEVSGSRFNYLKGGLAMLEFAIVQYVFSVLTNKEIVKKIAQKISPDFPDKVFTPVVPPVMIKPEIYVKMARLDPGQEEERFHLPNDNLYLVGSAEHTLGPIHMDKIIPEADLPLRYVGFSTAFRREAGSYGKDTRGILRVHQFDKIEMESFCLPELSVKEQDFFVAIQEYLLQELKLPYQAVAVCAGDMGGPDARQIDIETWMPGQNRYRETHTADLMTDYQARRLNTKIRRTDNSTEFIHMNDGTAFAIGRILIAIMENYQQKDGSILMPEVLQKYLGFEKISKSL